MNRITYLAALCGAIALLTACGDTKKTPPRKSVPGNTTTVITTDPTPTPVDTIGPKPGDTAAPPAETEKVNSVPVPPPAPVTNMEYAIKIPGKKGFVRSPYTKDDKMIDVRDLPPGTEAVDPYTNRPFLVP